MRVQPARRKFIFVLLGCLAVSLIAVVYPIYVIRPFRTQGARELAAALVVMRWRPAITLISAAAALAMLACYWRSQLRRWCRYLVAACAGLVCLLAVLARVNIYEQLMFHPDTHPTFQVASQAKLDGRERVISVKIGGSARAYPIRAISYHHVINDVVDRVAIVATY
jgi:hypothetical protein